MISGINSSKTSFFVWTIITTLLLVALFVLGYYDRANWGLTNEIIKELSAFIPKNASGILIKVALPVLLATFPIGISFKINAIGPKYIHIPTEKFRVFDTNPLAIFKLIYCEILFVIDVVLFALAVLFSFIAGPFVFIYTLISGIVLMAKKKI